MESIKLKSSATTRRLKALRFITPLSLLFLFIGIRSSAQATISTTAGGDSSGIRMPACVSVAANGDLFITDYENSAILKADSAGNLATVAGGNGAGFSGDGGLATKAQLRNPWGATPDGTGGFFIADTGNSRIRRVTADGVISTVAGNGRNGFSGDGGLATDAQLWMPFSVMPDGAGGFLVADTGNSRIRRADANGYISTVAGNGTAGFYANGDSALKAELNAPEGLASDGAGGYFIADYGDHLVRRVDASGIITTVAGSRTPGFSGDGGLAVKAQLNGPARVASDGAGGFYIADAYNNRIRRVNADGIISTVAGDGSQGFSGDGGDPAQAQLNNPYGVASVGSSGFYIADSGNGRIRRVIPDQALAGDVNGDGQVDLQDAALILQYAVGYQTPDAKRLAAADLNGDGKITLQDAVLELKKAIGS